MVKFTDIIESARMAAGSLAAFAGDIADPSLRLGVTGLSGSGKTVFITALVRNLTAGGRLPLLDAAAEGRLKRAYLEPQPDDSLPRFDYERHLESLLERRAWPQSTRQISQLRVTLEFEPEGLWSRTLNGGRLHVDIVDYPGEWLLDLPLLHWSFAEWSSRAIALSRQATRKALARDWHKHLASLDPKAQEDEQQALTASFLFKDYLGQCRDARFSLSALPPGRFLMPGDLEGSPALTFAPLDVAGGEAPPKGSLWAMMQRRYESYKAVVVKPFFRDHFARLDRQIVLVDALGALNAGPAALLDLETALGDILQCFRPGANSWLSAILNRRIERILFAATKADHLHRNDHDKLTAILERLTERAIARAKFAGAQVQVAAIAAVRATSEASVTQDGVELACIAGIPAKGQRIAGKTFNGRQEAVLFPGELPSDPEKALAEGRDAPEPDEADIRFVTFCPPAPQQSPLGDPVLPHIRLDRALNFLIGDRLR